MSFIDLIAYAEIAKTVTKGINAVRRAFGPAEQEIQTCMANVNQVKAHFDAAQRRYNASALERKRQTREAVEQLEASVDARQSATMGLLARIEQEALLRSEAIAHICADLDSTLPLRPAQGRTRKGREDMTPAQTLQAKREIESITHIAEESKGNRAAGTQLLNRAGSAQDIVRAEGGERAQAQSARIEQLKEREESVREREDEGGIKF